MFPCDAHTLSETEEGGSANRTTRRPLGCLSLASASCISSYALAQEQCRPLTDAKDIRLDISDEKSPHCTRATILVSDIVQFQFVLSELSAGYYGAAGGKG